MSIHMYIYILIIFVFLCSSASDMLQISGQIIRHLLRIKIEKIWVTSYSCERKGIHNDIDRYRVCRDLPPWYVMWDSGRLDTRHLEHKLFTKFDMIVISISRNIMTNVNISVRILALEYSEWGKLMNSWGYKVYHRRQEAAALANC